MSHEIRFPIDQTIKARFEKLVELLNRNRTELSRALFLYAIENFELELSKGRYPVFIEIPTKKVLKIKFEKD